MKPWIATILIALLISLMGFIYSGTCDDVKDLQKNKANEKTVQVILLQMQKSQDQKIINDRENRKDQQQINRQVQDQFQQNQMLLLKILQEKK